ncbi:MAG: sigma 54-interacting transcriptional regulator [Pseudomonadota bacterium]|nr:sigma 54-interacting transcriptional regulator [Pseudomonadota bacterium]
MPSVLCCWIGTADFKAAAGEPGAGDGPVGQAVAWGEFAEVVLFSDHPKERVEPFVGWLSERSSAPIHVHSCRLSRPTAFGEIHETVAKVLERLVAEGAELTFHLSPGTPAMAAVWIILAKTRFPAQLIESSQKYGVQPVHIPFAIAAEFVPGGHDPVDERLGQLAAAGTPPSAAFDDIVHGTAAMRSVLARAQRAAGRSVPVLIEGESGTGKELLAKAIHRTSPRAERPFIAVNCGAIPADLVESELFGHKKGAFTGAAADRPGHFEQANGGTLFLDEVGELPLPVQVKLLRVLQEREVTRIGESKVTKLDVRIIAATNRNLLIESTAGRFRSDLFYRLAVAVLRLPPLRERRGDLGLLIDRLLGEVNRDAARDAGVSHKILSPNARNLLMAHSWPGNVRELLNTLHRAAIWSGGDTITDEDIESSILAVPGGSIDGILDRPLGEGLDVEALQAIVARHYLQRALAEADGNKTKAAALVGLASYQTLTNWLKRYGVEE